MITYFIGITWTSASREQLRPRSQLDAITWLGKTVRWHRRSLEQDLGHEFDANRDQIDHGSSELDARFFHVLEMKKPARGGPETKKPPQGWLQLWAFALDAPAHANRTPFSNDLQANAELPNMLCWPKHNMRTS